MRIWIVGLVVLMVWFCPACTLADDLANDPKPAATGTPAPDVKTQITALLGRLSIGELREVATLISQKITELDPTSQRKVITQEMFEKIKTGITYKELEDFIGVPGDKVFSYKTKTPGILIPDIKTEAYVWHNPNGSGMRAIFQKGRLFSKIGFNPSPAPVVVGIPPTAQAPQDRVSQLERLGKLKEQGVLTNEEFEAEKKKILSSETP
jgi:hypothetical protein